MLELPQVQERVTCQCDSKGVQVLLWQREGASIRPLANPSQLRGAMQPPARRLRSQMRPPLPPWALPPLPSDSAAGLPLWPVASCHQTMLRGSLVLWAGVWREAWLWSTLLSGHLSPWRLRSVPAHFRPELRMPEDQRAEALLCTTVQVWSPVWSSSLLRLPQL